MSVVLAIDDDNNKFNLAPPTRQPANHLDDSLSPPSPPRWAQFHATSSFGPSKASLEFWQRWRQWRPMEAQWRQRAPVCFKLIFRLDARNELVLVFAAQRASERAERRRRPPKHLREERQKEGDNNSKRTTTTMAPLLPLCPFGPSNALGKAKHFCRARERSWQTTTAKSRTKTRDKNWPTTRTGRRFKFGATLQVGCCCCCSTLDSAGVGSFEEVQTGSLNNIMGQH